MLFERLYLNGILTPAEYRHEMGEQVAMHLKETRETKATLTADAGRVLAWHSDKEPAHISLAVPGDRAKLTASQALELAEWLRKQANEIAAEPNWPLKSSTRETVVPFGGSVYRR